MVSECAALARELPDYFTEAGVRTLAEDAWSHELYVALTDEQVVAFLVVATKSKAVREVLWMAVRRDMQGAGVGSALLTGVEGALRTDGARVIEVKTLAAAAAYPPYERTRRFYERAGFLQLDTIHPYPGWDPESPCAIYVKPLE